MLLLYPDGWNLRLFKKKILSTEKYFRPASFVVKYAQLILIKK